jgi:hypothetical protein
MSDRCRVSARQPSLLLGASRRAQPLLGSKRTQNHYRPVRPHKMRRTLAAGGRAELGEPVLSFVEGLRQGPPIHESVHRWGRVAGVGQEEVKNLRKLGTPQGLSPLERDCWDVDRSVSNNGGPHRRECLEII